MEERESRREGAAPEETPTQDREVPAKHSTGPQDPSKDDGDLVEETSEDSFPGSDAPAW